MNRTRHPSHRSSKISGRGKVYLSGVFTAALLLGGGTILYALRDIGVADLIGQLARWGLSIRSSRPMVLPPSVLKELQALDAVIDGASQPVRQREHDTFLVRPDQQLGWRLRPGVRLSAFVLKAPSALDLDPPVVYIKSDTSLSAALQGYLKTQTRLRYTCSTDADGFRTTVPHIDSPHKILMVGDSVLFGVGVNDDATMASALQQMVGQSLRVVNAGVGGYSGEQAVEMARQLTLKDRYEALIYIACQNDFMLKPGVPYSTQAQTVMRQFASLKGRFHDRMIVLLHTYMEYTVDDILSRWPRRVMAGTEALRNNLPRLARDAGIEYVDWTEVANKYMHQNGTIFARFALYADHCHLSPVGNHLAAQRLYGSLKKLALIK